MLGQGASGLTPVLLLVVDQEQPLLHLSLAFPNRERLIPDLECAFPNEEQPVPHWGLPFRDQERLIPDLECAFPSEKQPVPHWVLPFRDQE